MDFRNPAVNSLDSINEKNCRQLKIKDSFGIIWDYHYHPFLRLSDLSDLKDDQNIPCLGKTLWLAGTETKLSQNVQDNGNKTAQP